jgi:hypothetical protein
MWMHHDDVAVISNEKASVNAGFFTLRDLSSLE